MRLLLAAVVMLTADLARAAPLEVYGQLPSIERVAISPDGASLAIVWTDGAQRKVLVQRVADHKLIGGYGLGPAKIRSVQWAGNQHVIFTSSTTGIILGVESPREEWRIAYDLNLTNQRLRGLLGDTDESLNVVMGAPEVRMIGGKPVIFLQGVHFVQHQGVNTVFRVNLDSGISRMSEIGSEGTRDWVLASDGAALAQAVVSDRTGRWVLKQKIGGLWRDTRQMINDDHPDLMGLGRDGRSVLLQELKDGVMSLREVAPDGLWGEPLLLQDADEPIFDPAHHNLIGYYALVGDEGRYTFFDPVDQELWDGVRKAYPGQGVELVSWSDDHRKMVVRVDSPTDGAAYAVVDLNTREARWLGGEYDKLSPADIAPVKPVHFKAADGLELSGYVTLPRGAQAKNLPLVVFPHGGPAARDKLGFDWWAQAMASRGYAVLQVNFRGSDGYGWKFLSAGFGEWGRKMQTDLSDGVRYLANQGMIDPKRVCIVGASYGGYAALAGAALDPGVYSCAVSYAGVSDMRRFNSWVASHDGFAAQRYFLRFLGAESMKDPSLAQVSPASHIDKIAIPVLLIHGTDDTVVPLEQSRIMADALKAAGKPVQFVILDSTDHWLTNGDTRLAMLKATIAFLEKNDPPN
ncbi:MAG: alpha/beta hydrolase family protein [Caulobacterales bacterium]